jgi:outer membrane murein-binding lipoprotein Lpp
MIRYFRLFALVIAIVTMSVWLSTAAEAASKESVESYFQKARQDYLQKDMKAAAEEVHKAADYIKSEASAAKGKTKEALTTSYRELEKLSGELEKGTVKSVKKMEMAFARAYKSLATNSHVKSTEAWSKKEFKKVGDELETAVDELERGFAWAGQKAEAGTQKVFGESKELSKKLKEGASTASGEARKALKDMEDEIKTFGQKISSK